MVGKVSLLVLIIAVAANANPAANQPWHWIQRQLTVSPNFRALPFDEVAKESYRPRPKHVSETVVVDQCGVAPLAQTSPLIDPIIVGGDEVSPPHSFPWQVAIFINNLWFCGGAVLSNQWILTAAHCMDSAVRAEVVAGAQNIRVAEPSQVTMVSREFIVHENWKPFLIRNDIALIKLPQPLPFNNYIQPICLPTTTEVDLGAGVDVTATGWGLTSDDTNTISNVINQVTVPTITKSECAKTYGTFLITDDMICTSGKDRKGTCSGDSGGPLNYVVNGVTETRGIVSFGSSEGCQKGKPDSFTRVTHYLDWIKDNTGITRGNGN